MLALAVETSLLFCLVSTLQDGQIVYPTLFTPRNNNGRKVLRVNQNITLNLEKSEVFSDDFMFITESNNEQVHYLMKREYYERNLYHDEKSMASVIVNEDDGVQVEGILSDTMRIKPMAQMERSEDGRIAHTIYEIKSPLWTKEAHRRHRKLHLPPVINIDDRQDNQSPGLRKRRKKILHPEIHVVVDCAFAQEFKFSEMAVTLYISVFVNAVNLRFNSIRRPRIRLRVVGITMSKTKEPYLVPGTEDDQILDVETLTKFNEHYKNTVQFKNSDLLFLMTGLDMVFIEKNVTETLVAGVARTGGICQEDKVAMAEDRPRAYYGVYTFAHEVGHSLGCAHDGEPALNLPGHISSEKCPASDGYIMSYTMEDEKQYLFSECCQENIRNLVRQQRWHCLSEANLKKLTTNKDLPGMRTTKEHFCSRIFLFDYTAFYDKNYGVKDCKVRCRNKTVLYTVGAIDGTPCEENTGPKKHCILGKCVELQKQ
ncbi:venom metalloproteinase BumaMPs1-like [Dermacentor variabilis]|uniref:venom metalloproteinase BumaMPs1-like n=1 Tax=Dermacentor variabilis TaxID=34621 RepID=UPI003F5B0FF8